MPNCVPRFLLALLYQKQLAFYSQLCDKKVVFLFYRFWHSRAYLHKSLVRICSILKVYFLWSDAVEMDLHIVLFGCVCSVF